jgi:hypothetical protein
MNNETRTLIIDEAKQLFERDIVRAQAQTDTRFRWYSLSSASRMLAQIAPSLTDEELDDMHVQFVRAFEQVWQTTWGHIEVRDDLITLLRLHRMRMATEEMRRYAEERDYTEAWREAHADAQRRYDLLMERDGWTDEWAQLSERSIRYAKVMRARYDDYLDYGRLHI